MVTETGPFDDRTLDEAVAWYLRIEANAPGEDARTDFEAWVNACESNRLAYARVCRVAEIAAAGSNSPEITALRDASLARFRQSSREMPRPIYRQQALAAALIVFVCFVGAWFVLGNLSGAAGRIYQSAANEQKDVVLEDGSRISLDGSSRIEVRLSASARDIRLLKGQARFHVAHDTSRRFSVVAGTHTVLATGTDFNVERFPTQSIVTLIEGRVRVSARRDWSFISASSEANELSPGDQLTAVERGPAILRKDVSLADVTSWQHGKISLSDEPLSIAIERMNRHRAHPIRVAEAAVGNLRVSGVFDAGNTDAFIEAVVVLLPLRSTVEAGGGVVLAIR